MFAMPCCGQRTAASSWILIAGLLTGGCRCVGQNLPTLDEPGLTCSADTPVININTSVAIRAWALTRDGVAPSYSWTVDAGKIVGTGREVQWDFSGVPSSPQPRRATVSVTGPSKTEMTCTRSGYCSRGAARRARSYQNLPRKGKGYGASGIRTL